MREYELAFILHPRLDDDGVAAAVEQVSGWVVSNGGEVLETNPWGRRKLAYPIEKQWEGYYVIQRLRLPPTAVSELERNLRLSDDIMRYLIIRPGA
ncbi:MAG: 30S ribosomal protein S6 [Anaerolineae bacterium]|nr:30S ribosomal protein S6 [Anaerolineae bacterium]